jgi:hypothetical protein
MDTWSINIAQGETYVTTVAITAWPATYPALATATEWRLTMSPPGGSAFLTASSTGVSPMWVLNVAQTQGTLTIPAATTATFPLGQARFDFEIRFPGSVVHRLKSLGPAQVNTYAGAP